MDHCVNGKVGQHLMDESMTLAALLRSLRQERGMSLARLSRESGVAERSLRYWERGEHEPRLHELNRVLNALQATGEERERLFALLLSPQKIRIVHHSLQGAAPYEPRFDFGDLLRALRLRRQMSAAEAAGALRVHPTTLHRWEGSKVLPSEENLLRLCTLLGAHPQEQQALLQARQHGLLGTNSALTQAEGQAQLTVFQEQLDGYEGRPYANNLIDLQGVLLEAALWDTAKREPAAESLLLKAYAIHGPWLIRRGRMEEGLKYARSAFEVMRRIPEQQHASWVGALVVPYQVAMIRASAHGMEQAWKSLTEWSAVLTAPELQAHCYQWLANIASKRGQHDTAALLLNRNREAREQLMSLRSHYAETHYHALITELNDDARSIGAYTLARAGAFRAALALLPPPEMAQWAGQLIDQLLTWVEILLLAGERAEAHTFLLRAYDCIARHDLKLWQGKADRLALTM